eukprot:m.70774 g.70774  ORF g.70774 m.70774 type:complete len:330 (+) comp35707_c0_seq2:226-1215(+)
MPLKRNFQLIKPDIKRTFKDTFRHELPDFFIDTLELQYTQCHSEGDFWRYVQETLGLFRLLKEKGIPLYHLDCYVVHFAKPQSQFQEGDFFLQAGSSLPGTLSLKFYWNGQLRPSTVKKDDIPHLIKREYYEEICSLSNIGVNVFKKMLLLKGENEYLRFPMNKILQLGREHEGRRRKPRSVSLDSPTDAENEVEFRQRLTSWPKNLKVSRATDAGDHRQEPTFQAAVYTPVSRPPLVCQPSDADEESRESALNQGSTVDARPAAETVSSYGHGSLESNSESIPIIPPDQHSRYPSPNDAVSSACEERQETARGYPCPVEELEKAVRKK